MRRSICLLAVLALCLTTATRANAAILLSFAAGSSFTSPNPSITSLDILARSTDPTNPSDQLLGMVMDFEIVSGIFATPAGGFANSTGGDAGAFLFSGGALSAASVFDRFTNVTSSLSLDFNALAVFPNTDQRIGRLDINIDGLAPGTYPVSFQPSTVALNATGTAPLQAANGSFTVSPIPEPSSLLLLTVAGVLGIQRRRQRR